MFEVLAGECCSRCIKKLLHGEYIGRGGVAVLKHGSDVNVVFVGDSVFVSIVMVLNDRGGR